MRDVGWSRQAARAAFMIITDSCMEEKALNPGKYREWNTEVSYKLSHDAGCYGLDSTGHLAAVNLRR